MTLIMIGAFLVVLFLVFAIDHIAVKNQRNFNKMLEKDMDEIFEAQKKAYLERKWLGDKL